MPSPSLPVWLSPAVAGALSNTKGANTGADALTVQARYSTPAQTADPPAAVRFAFTRTPANSLQALLASDTFFLGPGSQNAPPAAVNKYAQTATWNGRIYIVGANGTGSGVYPICYSAQINGNSIGPWRLETMPGAGQITADTGDLGTRYSMVFANGYAFFTNNGDQNIWSAQVTGDGSFGTWGASTSTVTLSTNGSTDWVLNAFQATANVSSQVLGTWYVTALELSNQYGQLGGAVNSDGTVTWASQAGTIGVTTQKRGAATMFIPGEQFFLVAGGNNGSGTVATNIRYCVITAGLGTGWSNATVALPAARHYGSMVRVNGYYYHLGGATGATGQLPTNSPSGSVYYQAEATFPAGSMTTSGNSLATSLMMPMAAAQSVLPGVQGADIVTNSTGGKPTLFSVGGSANASTFGTTTQFSTLNPSTGAPAAFAAGATNNSLAAGDLGTNGAVTANSTGTVDVTFSYGALFAYAPNSTLANGDLIQVGVTFVSQAGYVSPTAYASIMIGQVPTIGSVSPANASAPSTGIPAISFTYSAGAGGGPQLTYRIKVSHGGTTDFDTGVVYGNANALTSAQVRALLTSAFLVTGTAYTLAITVTSTDTPMSGSSASATSSTTFTPSLAAAAATPTTVSATASQTAGSVVVQWTNPGGSTAVTNRVYYRLTGVGSYVLLKDNITATIGSAQSITVYEPLVFGQAYDFVVSACTAVRESAQSSSATSAAISPASQWPSGFVAMLSIAGAGATQDALFLVAPPRITRMMDSQAQLFFGDTAMRYRYGVQNMRRIELSISNTITQMASLDTVISAAFAGQTLVYRDVAGNLIYCGFGGERPGVWDLYRDDTLSLTESVYTYTP